MESYKTLLNDFCGPSVHLPTGGPSRAGIVRAIQKFMDDPQRPSPIPDFLKVILRRLATLNYDPLQNAVQREMDVKDAIMALTTILLTDKFSKIARNHLEEEEMKNLK